MAFPASHAHRQQANDELWKQRHYYPVDGLYLTCLNDDALLLVLSGHGVGHRWSQLEVAGGSCQGDGRSRRGQWCELLALAERLKSSSSSPGWDLALGQLPESKEPISCTFDVAAALANLYVLA
jgi:hypothetical protein